MSLNCPICNSPSSFFTSKKDRFLQEYKYYKCKNCRFLFDEDLVKDKKNLEIKTSKVYDKDYFSSVDSGWKERGDKMIKVINFFISAFRLIKPSGLSILDYGAGNGYVTSKIGKNEKVFYYDKYESPTYQGKYDILKEPKETDILCAVELVEHLTDIKEWDLLSGFSKSFMIITTEVSNGIEDKNLVDWVYVNPNAGHTGIYSFEALFLIAKQHGYFYIFFPYKFSHIFFKNKLLSRFNFVKLEYFVYKLLKIFKKLI